MTIPYERPGAWNVLDRGQPYEPFPWQIEHLHAQVDRGVKRIILPCGRRSGKSYATIAEVAREVMKEPELVLGKLHPPLVYIIGPTAEASMRVWTPIWNAFVPPESGSYKPPLSFLYKTHDKTRGIIELQNGAVIYRKTADDPRSMQGERVTLAVTDETQDINEEAWQNLMPGLSDSEGRLIAIGIPRGKGRFRSYYMAGQGSSEEFYSASVPSTANPVFQMRAAELGITAEQYLWDRFGETDLTDEEFKRQYLAQWIEEDGQVFSKYERYFTGSGYSDPEVGTHIMGLDLGKLHDFTVAYIGNVGRQEIVNKYRVNKVEYIDQVPKIAELYHQYRCRFIHMDTNGVGEAPAEMLRALGCSIIPFKWSNATKQGLVQTMVREVQRGHVTFLKDDEDLKKEMSLFEGTVSPGGVIRYEAPKGYYDDCVISAALLIQKMARNKNMSKAQPKPYVSFTGSKQGSLMPKLPV